MQVSRIVQLALFIAFLAGAEFGPLKQLCAQSAAQSNPSSTNQTTGTDEGVLRNLSVAPTPFSPGFSPKEKDTAAIGFELSRELPIHLRILSAGGLTPEQQGSPADLVRAVSPVELKRQIGELANRFLWDGILRTQEKEAQQPGGTFLPDGQYSVEAYSSASFNWRYGDPLKRPPGVIYRPHAIAADPASGRLFLSGMDCRIDVYAADGSYLQSVEPKGKSGQRLRGPIYAMAFGAGGSSSRLLILLEKEVASVNLADGATDSIARLPEDGPALKTDWLDGLAVDRSGRIYVGCAAASRIFVFDASGRLLRTLGSAGKELGQFTNLGDLAIGAEGHLYVTDAPGKAGRIQIFDSSGKPLRAIHTIYDEGPLPMGQPHSLVALDDGSLIVAEGAGGPVPAVGDLKAFARIDRQGKLLAAWGQRGSGEGEVCFVSRMTSGGGKIYFSDHYGNHRVIRTDISGRWQQTYQTPPGIILRPMGIVRLSSQQYLVADADLQRCTLFTRDGQLAGSWSFWEQFGETGLDGPVAVCAGPEKVYLLHADQLLTLDHQGEVLARTKLEELPACASAPPGLLVDRQQRILVTGSLFDVPPAPGLDSLGKLIAFDPQGKKLWSVAATEGGMLFGPIDSRTESQRGRRLEEKIYVQVARRNEAQQLQLGVCEIRLDQRAEPKLLKTVWLTPAHGMHLRPEGPFACAAGSENQFLKGGHNLMAFDAAGQMTWTLGDMREKSYEPGALLFEEPNVVSVDGRTGHLESWNIGSWNLLASEQVEIDNTPPRVGLSGTDSMVTGGGELFSLGGTATDRNFSHYRVFWRSAGLTRSGKPYHWTSVQNEDFIEPVAEGLLAQWKIPTAVRDRGIEVKVIAWDTAGNSSESLPNEIAFDDDSDGLSNGLELTLNTDPRQKTELAGSDAVQIEVDMQSLIRPYFFNQYEHELRFVAYDVRDPQNPIPLNAAQFTVYAEAGSLKGGTSVQPESGWLPVQPESAGDAPGGPVQPWSKGNASKGVVHWTAPDTAEGLTKTLLMRTEFPKQGVNNVLYESAVLERQLEVQRDNDRDWIPDDYEVASGSPFQTTGTKDAPDSDGDGVIDGVDIAPQTSYGSDTDWSSLYAPGMIRYTDEMVFYGLGGGKSAAFKYEEQLSNKNIMYSDRIRDQNKIKDYLNDVVFDRNNSNPLKRKRLAVVGWEHYGMVPPEDEEFISDATYKGAGHPDCRFIYYALQAYGAPIIENPDVIDGRSWADAGIHRNYLKASAPGLLDEFDRKLKIQWKVLGRDLTSSDSTAESFTRMGWLVEVFDNEDRKGEHLSFSGLAITQSDIGGHIYETSLDLPSEQIFRGQPLHLKLTPCWITRNGRPMTCPHCKARVDGNADICPTEWCRAPLERYNFTAVDRNNLSVSGVLVDAPVEVVEWVQRIKPRTGSIPLSPETLDQLTDAAEQMIRNEAVWPVTNNGFVREVSAEGQTYSVLFVSTRAMNQLPNSMSRSQKEARLVELTNFATGRLAAVDVVCLIANDARKLQDLKSRIDWGSDGTWADLKAGQEGSETVAGAQTDPATPGQTLSEDKVDPATVAKTIKAAKSSYTIGKLWYRSWDYNAKWKAVPEILTLKDGKSITAAELLNQSQPHPVLTGEGSPKLVGNRTITVQKCFDEPNFRINSRATVKRPWRMTIDPKTGEQRFNYFVVDEYILHRTEKVSDPRQSKLLAQGPDIAGTTGFNRKLMLDRAFPYLDAGFSVMTNGLQVYSCLNDKDALGVLVFTLKGTGEVLQVVARAKGAEGLVVNGLKITGTTGARLNVVAVAAGAMEAGYYLYKASKAPNPIEESLCIERSLGSALNAGLGAIEPFGGAILGGWFVGGMLGNSIADLAGMDNNEAAAQIAESPGMALIVLPLHWLPESLDAGTAKMAAREAQKIAIKKVEAHNLPWNRKRTYVWVPPN